MLLYHPRDYDCVLSDCTRIPGSHPTYLCCRHPILCGNPLMIVHSRAAPVKASDVEDEDKQGSRTKDDMLRHQT